MQLVEVRFIDSATAAQRITVRGKTAGAFGNAGTFQWTSAVRGMCILLARAKKASVTGEDMVSVRLAGFRSSFAASLDYAITKQPGWIRDMFGSDSRGNTLAQRLFSRTNPNRKRPGPVVLALNERALSASDVSIVWNGQRVQRREVLQDLLLKIGDVEEADVSGCSSEVVTGLVAA